MTSCRTRPPVGAIVLFTCALALCSGAGSRPGPSAARTLTTQFTYAATVPGAPAGTRDMRLWIPIPSDGEWQTIHDLEVQSPLPYRITKEKRFGNRMVFIEAKPATGPLTVAVTFTATRREIRLLGPTADSTEENAARERGSKALAAYFGPDRRVPLGGRYGQIAAEVAGSKATPLEKMHALFDHVVDTMQYDYKKESPEYAQGDVAFVCDYKKGNCSDLHSYLMSLARSLGVPTYIEYGFPLTGVPVADPLPKEGSVGGYHCWLWFRDPQRGWLPLDASDARRWQDAKQPANRELLFGNLVLERSAVALSHGRDITLSPPQKQPPLNDFIYPYAEADGQPVKVSWEVRYRRP